MKIEDAVEKASTECIKEGILKDFLERNRMEAKAVSIYEYDQEAHIKMEREEAFEEGKTIGLQQGKAKGQERVIKLIQSMINDGESEQISKLTSDELFFENMLKKYNIE